MGATFSKLWTWDEDLDSWVNGGIGTAPTFVWDGTVMAARAQASGLVASFRTNYLVLSTTIGGLGGTPGLYSAAKLLNLNSRCTVFNGAQLQAVFDGIFLYTEAGDLLVDFGVGRTLEGVEEEAVIDSSVAIAPGDPIRDDDAIEIRAQWTVYTGVVGPPNFQMWIDDLEIEFQAAAAAGGGGLCLGPSWLGPEI